MINTLQNWNRLLNESLSHANHSLSEELAESILSQLKEEKNNVRQMIVEDILERTKLKDKKEYIRLFQLLLATMMDKLFCHQQEHGCPVRVQLLFEKIQEHLEKTLNFIGEFFADYFDFNQKVPHSVLSKCLQKFEVQIKQLKKYDQFSCSEHLELLKLILKKVEKFCLCKESVPTYNQLQYQKELLCHLTNPGKLSSVDSIKETLIYLNYNDEEYSQFVYSNLIESVNKVESKNQKISLLLLEQKKINQLPVRSNYYLLKEMPSLKKQLSSWLEEEIKYLQKDETIPNMVRERVFIHVPFRGTEIYLLHKAFIDSGGAAGETYKSLFEKTASHLTNNNQKGFSIESLQKNSDKINYEVKDNVKRFLQKMIRNIESY